MTLNLSIRSYYYCILMYVCYSLLEHVLFALVAMAADVTPAHNGTMRRNVSDVLGNKARRLVHQRFLSKTDFLPAPVQEYKEHLNSAAQLSAPPPCNTRPVKE